jgi:hypothetical protein
MQTRCIRVSFKAVEAALQRRRTGRVEYRLRQDSGASANLHLGDGFIRAIAAEYCCDAASAYRVMRQEHTAAGDAFRFWQMHRVSQTRGKPLLRGLLL